MEKEDIRFMEYVGVVVLIVVMAAVFLLVREPDISFARGVFSGLIKGDESVKEAIEWPSFKAMGNDLGAVYVKLPSDKEKEFYKQAFILNFALGFKSSGGKFSSFTHWRIIQRDKQGAIVAADIGASGERTALFAVSKKHRNKKLVAIEWEEKR